MRKREIRCNEQMMDLKSFFLLKDSFYLCFFFCGRFFRRCSHRNGRGRRQRGWFENARGQAYRRTRAIRVSKLRGVHPLQRRRCHRGRRTFFQGAKQRTETQQRPSDVDQRWELLFDSVISFINPAQICEKFNTPLWFVHTYYAIYV